MECHQSIFQDSNPEGVEKVCKYYLEFQRKTNGCFRRENNQTQIQKLTYCRGLDSIALDENKKSIY
ncbi:hypothetical protein GLOIN_2v1765533 [Rhizophagus irregularis DAOM 181602=DAOM 197198]|uniref:Uncharacterized protein n=1 Tax=Rhizophagus irregularis (strain DAOM 181602 / DAOM 197198 / MUCL 43194) TaxID=747089 RepID=A0A2P4QPM4_RHIID|nr:hypothetical protein GLOIN_2v1765533 [Rhizophagus irregularis DAOM 181602=DAOM 197198]POG79585.1 hypothetical protein GLOIN_2v1765533 [Rhizophagus irregularis DAOM 181602=DAOM 197198]GET57355.1 hypothetical protein GLOIN_2v1765533 [Rhizophagus irregularis DAOM 181602=DAOM 197198]|eukprot:XP_025186451.1 hypothetical protein GLOIN_2v1765533 [Rhizophagus irregularis DAOM 181602=DAOM 197198]